MYDKENQVFFGYEDTRKPITDFSEFFHNASAAEKKKLLTEVVREANKDQRDLLGTCPRWAFGGNPEDVQTPLALLGGHGEFFQGDQAE